MLVAPVDELKSETTDNSQSQYMKRLDKAKEWQSGRLLSS